MVQRDDHINFTKRTLEALPTPKYKRAAWHDKQTRGLGLLVQPTGHKSFFWFRKVRGAPTWKTIGAFPDLTVEQARSSADQFNTDDAADIFSGEIPTNPDAKLWRDFEYRSATVGTG
jgi:hypothetical protein